MVARIQISYILSRCATAENTVLMTSGFALNQSALYFFCSIPGRDKTNGVCFSQARVSSQAGTTILFVNHMSRGCQPEVINEMCGFIDFYWGRGGGCWWLSRLALKSSREQRAPLHLCAIWCSFPCTPPPPPATNLGTAETMTYCSHQTN